VVQTLGAEQRPWITRVIEFVNGLSVFVAIMVLYLKKPTIHHMHEVDAWQSLGILTCGLNFLTLLRGLEWFAFMLNMLEHITVAVLPFSVVLAIIMTV
jgi:hypothetical protein